MAEVSFYAYIVVWPSEHADRDIGEDSSAYVLVYKSRTI